jgi:hypothetical protein
MAGSSSTRAEISDTSWCAYPLTSAMTPDTCGRRRLHDLQHRLLIPALA